MGLCTILSVRRCCTLLYNVLLVGGLVPLLAYARRACNMAAAVLTVIGSGCTMKKEGFYMKNARVSPMASKTNMETTRVVVV